MKMIMINYNVLQKRLILKNIKKISPGKYPMLLYVAVSIRWISIRFDAKLILDQTLHLLSGPGQKM